MKINLFIGLLLYPILLFGQHYYSKNFTINDGLPSNTVRCILKDSQDRMWIGTGAGLCLFDGVNFKTIGTREGLVGENVFSITEDDHQNIWIGSMGSGISKYDGKHFTNYNTSDGLVSNNIRVVWYSKKFDLLFIGTNEGCSVFDFTSFKSLSFLDTHSGSRGLYVMGFLEGKDFVNIYSYDHQPLYRYFPKTGHFIQMNDQYYIQNNTSCSPLVLSNRDTIMGFNRSGVHIINDRIKKTFENIGQVFDLEPDEFGNIWIACWSENSLDKKMPGGLYKYDCSNIVSCSKMFGIQDPTVWSLYYDSTFHILWVGTLNTGLYKIPLSVFEWYDKDDIGVDILNVFSLLPTDDGLFIGTEGNVLLRDNSGKVRILNTNPLKRLNPKSPHQFKCIQRGACGNVSTGSYQSNLISFSPKDNYSSPRIIQVKPGATQFAFVAHDTIYYTDRWWDGVYRCSVREIVTQPLYSGFKHSNAPPNVTKIVSRGDTIWYCSQTEGLFKSLYGKFEHFRKQDPTLPKIVNDICFDIAGNIIVGSNTGEVIIASHKNERLNILHRLHSGRDIVGNTVKFLISDKSNHLYVGTNTGLNRIDLNTLYKKNTLIVNYYDSEIGYDDCTGKTAVCDDSGNIWIGTDSHLLKIDTRLLESFQFNPLQIEFTGLDVNFKPDTSIRFKDNTTFFSYQQNNLIFHFRSNNYLNPGQVFYRYKLEGLSDNWSEYSNSTAAVFTSLRPGKYHLIVQSYNRLNNTSITSVDFTFRIRYPWYLNVWFLSITLLVLIFLIYWIIQYRTRQIRIEAEKKSDFTKQLASIEMRALQSQMNPHFVFNAINSIQGFILKNKTDEALGYLMDFSKILRLTLENADRESITLSEEMEYIGYYLNLELMRFDKKFKIIKDIPENLNPQVVQIPPMILQPYIENAIRHGLMHKKTGKGILKIQFSVIDEEILQCVIEDNGVGRTKSREIESWKQPSHKPQSTRITQERFELLNKNLESDKYQIQIIDLVSTNGNESTGTRVVIELPLLTV